MMPVKNTPERGPFDYTKSEIASALKRLGYARFGDPACSGTPIDPEMLTACLVYSRDGRWLTAVAVVLCKAQIDWKRMVQLATDYGFAGTLRGMIEAVRNEGHAVGAEGLAMLESYAPIKPACVMKVLKTYVS